MVCIILNWKIVTDPGILIYKQTNTYMVPQFRNHIHFLFFLKFSISEFLRNCLFSDKTESQTTTKKEKNEEISSE